MVVAVVGALLGAPVVDAAVTTSRVTGTDVGAIPNDPGTLCGGTGAKPRDVHFDVSGITGPIRDVSVEFTLNPAHSWIGDLDVLLIAPGGAEHRLFGGVGSTTPNSCGDSSDLGGPISFSDDAPAQPTLWGAAASASGAVPSGAYRASTNGGGPSGGQPTSITATFASLRGNGLWTLRFTDRSPTDTGSVSSAALSIRHGNPAPPPGPEVLFDNGPLGTGTTTDGGDPAPPGSEWSELQHPVGDLSEANLFLGESMDGPFDNERVADDFTVPAGETWTIGSFDTYGFTSGLPAPGRFYSATLQIWTGPPSTPSGGFTRLFGDGSTNRLAATAPTGIYRTLNTVAPAAADPAPRMIWRNSIEVDPPLTLPPGTYWAEWGGPRALRLVRPPGHGERSSRATGRQRTQVPQRRRRVVSGERRRKPPDRPGLPAGLRLPPPREPGHREPDCRRSHGPTAAARPHRPTCTGGRHHRPEHRDQEGAKAQEPKAHGQDRVLRQRAGRDVQLRTEPQASLPVHLADEGQSQAGKQPIHGYRDRLRWQLRPDARGREVGP